MAVDKQRTETLVGFFFFVGIALLAWLILTFGRLDSGYDEVYRVDVRFSDASGVIEGTSVKLAGALIGKVAATPTLEPGMMPRVRVPIDIRADRPLPANAVFQIQSASVLGDKVITVSMPEEISSEVLVSGALLDGAGASGLEAIQTDAVAMAGDARILMADARTSLLKFDAALDDIRSVAGRLSDTVEQINGGVLSEQNVSSLGRTLSNIEDASIGARNASADLKPVLVDARQAIQQVNRLAEKAEGTFAEIDAQLAHVGPAMEDVPEAVQALARAANKAEGAVGEAEKTFAKAGQTLDTINQGDGLVGTLTQDDEVSTDTKTFIKNLRRHGILGYRDEESDEKDPRERFSGRRR